MLLLPLAAFILLIIEVGDSPRLATGAGFAVDSTADAVDAAPGDGVCATEAGQCSLRAAIQETNALPGPDTVQVPTGTFTLTIPGANEDSAATGDLDITDDLTLTGAVLVILCPAEGCPPCPPGPCPASIGTTVDAAGLDRVFHVVGPIEVSIRWLIIRGGQITDPFVIEGGGALYNPEGIVDLTQVVLRDNNSLNAPGGGLDNRADMTITRALVAANSNQLSATGGGIANAGALTVRSSDVEGNTAAGTGGGVSSFGDGSDLQVESSTISRNQADDGGGVLVGFGSTAAIRDASITQNSALVEGGGIWSHGAVTVTDTTISENTAPGGGGGLSHGLADSTFDRVTFSGNEGTPGGGLYLGSGTISVLNSTISNNRAPSQESPFGLVPGTGAGIRTSFGALELVNVTLADNRADDDGGAIHHLNAEGGTVSIENSVFARNLGDAGVENCFGSVISNGHNVEDAGTCSLTAPGDLQVADALLGPLSDNGGATLTHALLRGSPAVDAAAGTACPGTDQRGVGRPIDGDGDGVARCDIGAYEAPQGTASTATPMATPTPSPTPVALPRTGGAP